MNAFWYRLLEGCARLFGAWLLAVFARMVACGYFLFSPRRKESLRFYRRLFPGRSGLFHMLCVFRQYQRFTTIHCDRFLARQSKSAVSFTSEGLEQLGPCLNQSGAVLLMSHLGNWEMAAQLLPRQFPDLRLLLYMGEKQKEGVDAAQKEALRAGGVRIIAMHAADEDPLALVEGIRFVRAGGVASLPGDLLLKADQRHFFVDFLDGRVRLPAAPFVLARLAEAPLFAFFAFRVGPGRYHFTMSAVPMSAEISRNAALQQAAQTYAGLLEKALRDHPLDWFHFERFVEERE